MNISNTRGARESVVLIILLLITALFLSGCSSATEVVANYSTTGQGSIVPDTVPAGAIHFVPQLDGKNSSKVALIINTAEGSAVDADKPHSGQMIWTLPAGSYFVLIVSPDQSSIQRRSLTVK